MAQNDFSVVSLWGKPKWVFVADVIALSYSTKTARRDDSENFGDFDVE